MSALAYLLRSFPQAVVPSVLQLLAPCLAAAAQQLALRQLVSSGEPLPVVLAQQLATALPTSCALLNLYGACATQ